MVEEGSELIAPQVIYQVDNGRVLFDIFVNRFFHSLDERDMNPFIQTTTSRGEDRSIVGEMHISTENLSINASKGSAGRLKEDTLAENGPMAQQLRGQGVQFQSEHDEFRSWDERKISRDQGLPLVSP